jgi:hypothetical protein
MTTTPDRFLCKPDPVHVGGSLTIQYENPDLAGQTVTIKIVDTGIGQIVEKDIVLNADGIGAIEWGVPMDWGPFATMEGPDSRDATVIVTGSSDSLLADSLHAVLRSLAKSLVKASERKRSR